MCKSVEFFRFPSGEGMYRQDGVVKSFSQNDTALINYSFQYIGMHYSDAMTRLNNMYATSQKNISFFRFRIVDRFARCNFSSLDTSKLDIDEDGHFNLEFISCPLRGGECPDEGVICQPRLTLNIRRSEMMVFAQLKNGLSYDEIGVILNISPITVKHHCEALRRTLGIPTNEKLIAFWHKNNMHL